MIKPQHSLKLYQKGINFPNYTPRNYSNNIYYQNQYLDNDPITPTYKVDSYYSDYFNFNKSKEFYRYNNRDIIKNNLSPSQYKQYTNINIDYLKANNREKHLLGNSDLMNNNYRLDGLLIDNLDNINFKNKIKKNKRSNTNFSDNIIKNNTIMNYNYKYNTLTFNTNNSNNIRINHKSFIINTDNISNLNTILNKNYNRSYNFNDNKAIKDYNNNSYYNIKSNVDNTSKNDDSIKYAPKNLSFISNNYNYNINNYYDNNRISGENKSSNNIKYKENSEVQHTFNKYSNINRLKQQNLFSNINLENFNKNSKSHEKDNLFYLKNKENTLKLNTIDDILPKSFYEKINLNKNKNILKKNIVIYKTKTKINNEIKNKILNDIKLKKANIKPILTHKYRTNNNSKKDLDKNINKKNDLKNSSSSLNKENHIIINKYNIYNINILPTNNFIKKEIIITKDPNSVKSSNTNNKTIVKSLQNYHTDEKLISKSGN